MTELRKYGAATTIVFPLVDRGALDFESTPVTFAAGDTQISKDEGAFANTGSNPVHEGNGMYSLALTATEMQAARIMITLIDQTATKLWEDQAIIIDTYGNASAQHAVDLDDGVRAGLTALPNAAADAAGGLAISDAGALDLDTLNSNVSAILTDTGTTLQAELDGIQADTENIQSRLPAALVGGRIDANTGAISGDATAADNLKLMYDGTGYTDDTAPASRAQVNAIGAASGGSLNFAAEDDNTGGAIKSVTFVGSQTNTFASTEAEDGTNHTIDDTGNAFDIVYQFDIGGGRTATEATFKGYLTGSNDSCNIQVYDFVGADWETIQVLSGQAGSVNVTLALPLLSKHTGTGADLGNVLLRFVTTGQSSPQLNVDQLLVAGVNIGLSVGYALGAIWIDTNNGTAGTEAFVNGVADNPVDSLADALTLSSALGLTRFVVAAGSSITLSADATNYELMGESWNLAFGGQTITGAHIVGATVSGTFVGSTGILERCIINAITGPGMVMRNCFINEVTMTNNGTGNWYLNDCRSRIAGTGRMTFDFGVGVGNTGISIRNYSGGMEFENMGDTGTDAASVEGFGNIVLNANCDGGTLAVRGMFTLTDNSGNVTISDDARIDVAQINAQADTALTDYDPPTKAEMDSGFAALNDLTAAQVNAEVDTALADYDGPTKAEMDAGFAALNDVSTAEILAMAYESTETFQDFLRLARATLVGKANGLETTTANYRDLADAKNRVVSTVDEFGNRSAVTTDAT